MQCLYLGAGKPKGLYAAWHFQLELNISEYCKGNKSIQNYYSGLSVFGQAEFMESVYNTVPEEWISALHKFHKGSQRN